MSGQSISKTSLTVELDRISQELFLCQQRLDESQALAHCGSWELDIRTRMGWLSTEQRRLFNLTPSDDISTPEQVLRHHHPEDIQQVLALIEQAVHTKTPFSMETRILCDDGTIRWLQAQGSPVLDIAGNVTRLVGTTIDITERKRIEQALKDSQTRQEALQRATLDAIITIDAQEHVLEWNAVAEKIFNYSAAEARGKNLSELIVPHSLRDRHKRGIAHFLKTGEGPALNQRTEVPALRADGTEFLIEVTAFPVQVGDQVFFTAYIRDLTMREQAKEALRQSTAALQAIVETAPVILSHYNTEGLVTFVCGAGRAVLGVPTDQRVGRSIAELAQDKPLFAEGVFRALQGEEVSVEMTENNITLRTDFRPQYSDTGELIGAISLAHDITEQKLRDAEKEKALGEAHERAERDPLTDLWNHRAFYKRLNEELARAERERTTLAVVMIDLDNFKFFNDVYGHATGDEVLRLIAQRLRETSRSYDVLARFGGDEFAMILPNVGSVPAIELEARLKSDLRSLAFHPEGYESAVPLSLSLGLSLYPNHSQNRSELVEFADLRLRHAKTGGESGSEAERARARISESLEGFSMLDALVTAVDNKDRYTQNHSEDVLAYSLQIARQLDLDEETQHTIAVAALLHDVGKIGVPDAILRKPGRLTDAEFSAVKQHAAMGAAIVSAVPGLESILDIVRHHHERWDGAGYPAGLAGEEIPFLARLMAVADAFSAMTTDRPYRLGMPCEKARAILRAGAGTQWDSAMVDAFLPAK